MSKDNSDLNGCCWVFAILVFLGFLGMGRCGGGSGTSSSQPSSASSEPSGSVYPNSSSSTRIHSHESYISASEAEKRQWAAEKEAELRRKGINNTSAKDLKDAMDAFYSR